MKRLIVVLISVLGLIVLSATMGGTDLSAGAASSSPAIVFDDAAQQAQLIIPTPSCPTTQPDCQWKFVLQIPKGDITVGVVYGTSGTLTIAYPKNFCGVIQADAYQGPPFVPQRGFQHTIPSSNCITPVIVTTTTTSTTSTSTTSTTAPVVPPPATGHTPPSPPAAPRAAPVALPSTAAAPTQLPFTGVDTKPLWFIGLTLVAFGLALLTSASTVRKVRWQVLAVVQGRLLVPSRTT